MIEGKHTEKLQTKTSSKMADRGKVAADRLRQRQARIRLTKASSHQTDKQRQARIRLTKTSSHQTYSQKHARTSLLKRSSHQTS